MVLPSLEQALESIGRPEVPADIAAAIGQLGIADGEVVRLSHYCTGERLARTGRAAMEDTIGLSENDTWHPGVTLALLERSAG